MRLKVPFSFEWRLGTNYCSYNLVRFSLVLTLYQKEGNVKISNYTQQ